jgi:hypothetical protein
VISAGFLHATSMCDIAASQRAPLSALALCHWIQKAVHSAAKRCLAPPS